jgi:hypothetical protein
VANTSPTTNPFRPQNFSEHATISTPTKCRSSGIQSTPNDRKRILPKIDSLIWASVMKRSSFSATRNPMAVAAHAAIRFFQVKNDGSWTKSV